MKQMFSFLLFVMVAATTMAAGTNFISAYPNTTSLLPGDLFIIERPGVSNYNVNALQMPGELGVQPTNSNLTDFAKWGTNSFFNVASNKAVSGLGSAAFTATSAYDAAGTAQTVADTSSNLVYGNSLTQINTTSNSVVATGQASVNTASNSVYASANTAINTSSNSLNTLINTSSNLVFGTSTNAAIQALPSRTNFFWATNETVGLAVVIVGPDANGQFYLKGTNWPTGTVPNGLVTNLAGADIVVTNAGVNTTITSNSVTTGTGTFNGGAVSLIPTNASVVLTSNGVAATLPFGVTNSLAGRAEPVVQYYMIDGASGVPVMTCSNETTGVKLTKGKGSLASLTETNWFTLPITSTNTIWRIRDESTGSGASVGIITNWFIGL